MLASQRVKYEFPDLLLFDSHIHPYIEKMNFPDKKSILKTDDLLKEAYLDGAVMVIHVSESDESNACLSGLLESMRIKRYVPAIEVNKFFEYGSELFRAHVIKLGDLLIPAHPLTRSGIINRMYFSDKRKGVVNGGKIKHERVPVDYARECIDVVNEIDGLAHSVLNPCMPLVEDVMMMESKGVKLLMGTDFHLRMRNRLGLCGSMIPGRYGGLNLDNLLTALTRGEVECFFTDQKRVYYTDAGVVHEL